MYEPYPSLNIPIFFINLKKLFENIVRKGENAD